jgi:hypothetical protein
MVNVPADDEACVAQGVRARRRDLQAAAAGGGGGRRGGATA